MKKYKLIINILLVFVFAASVIALALICRATNAHWEVFNNFLKDFHDHPDYNSYLSETLCLTFSIIFSALAAIASAITFFLLNFKVWIAKKN